MWKTYALLSAFFAALTAIFAKVGVRDVNSNLATAIRTTVILVLTWGIVLFGSHLREIRDVSRHTWLFLVLSGVATGLSWLCYFKAIQLGDVARVAPIDKLSVVITIILAFVFLQEKVDMKVVGFNSSDIGIFTNQEKYKSNMRKNYVTMLCLAMMLVACGQQTKQKETTMEFTDQVKEALADGGRIALDSLQWTREPKDYEVKGDTILITTAPKTDLWQRTYYHFQNDNAPVLQMKTREKFFSFVVKTDFTGSHHRFDQCGIVMYLGSENWLKGSVEYENEEFQHLGSVVTNNGYSDWATTAIPAEVKTMWYRFSRREDDYCIECSADGQTFSQMRVCHMPAAADEISFGIYACSPEESSFTAIFSDMKITECAWQAHDGQQPDE